MQHPHDDIWIAWALDDVEGQERGDLEAHRRDCDRCRAHTARLSRLLQAAGEPRAETLPSHVLEDLLALQQRTPARSGWRRLVLAATIPALAAVLFLAGYRQGRRASSTPAGPVVRESLPPPPQLPFEAFTPADWMQSAELTGAPLGDRDGASPVDSL